LKGKIKTQKQLDRRWYRKHWSTGDSNLFEWIAQKRGMSYDPTQDIENEIDGIRGEEKRDYMGEIHGSLHLLPEDEQKIIWWYFMEGRTLQDCANELGVVVSTVYKKKNNAIARLQKILGVKK
jgi:RNA polymerase sigma factor (sigma-70 family)